MRYRLKHICEYGALRCAAAFSNALPYRAALAAAWLCSAFAFHVLRWRRAEAERRIRSVFGPGMPARRVRRIARVSLRNMMFNCVEIMRGGRIDREWVDRRIPGFAREVEALKELVRERGGAVITVPHCGNWDLAGWACHRHGVSVFSIAARQKNPLVNAWVNRLRETGMTVLERGGGTLRQVLRLLRTGHALAILPDVRMKTPDLEVPFLGGTLNAGRGMALFAIAAGVPVVPAVFRREGWARHSVLRLPALFPDPSLGREEDARRLTEAVLAGVDRAVREAPEQWFWYNKRWALTPVGKGRAAPAGAGRPAEGDRE